MIDHLVILANGDFPTHNIPLKKLEKADAIICCDGAAEQLVRRGVTPHSIVGDLDSLPNDIKQRFHRITIFDSDQESNDLTKAFKHSLELSPCTITILGATGKREDHTLGNISLLAEYASQTKIPVEMITDYGKFNIIFNTTTIGCTPGQHLSFFTFDKTLRIKSTGLKYPLDNVIFDIWWKATLNECTSHIYRLTLSHKTPVVIYTPFK